jgi:hypothetical protein
MNSRNSKAIFLPTRCDAAGAADRQEAGPAAEFDFVASVASSSPYYGNRAGARKLCVALGTTIMNFQTG